jgi:hypothetical protein
MATIVPIQGGPETAKIRSVFAPALLPFITFGIYLPVWWFKINRELADLGRKHNREDLGTSPGLSLVAVLIGWIIIIPPILSVIGTYKRVKLAQQLAGVPEIFQANGAVFGWTYVLASYVSFGYLQNELNKVWLVQQHGVVTTPGGIPTASTAPNFMKA